MKKRDIFNYYRDIDNNNNESESDYDFSAVDLRGENHSNDEYDEFGLFAFDDDSRGVLPFDDDLELVEEDFTIPNPGVGEKTADDEHDSDDSSDTDDDFVLEKPDDAPDFTEEFLEEDDDDNAEENAQSFAGKLFSIIKKEESSVSDPDDSEVQDVPEVPDVEVDIPVTRRNLPKMRDSALQPLLVISRSKYSFDPGKKHVADHLPDESDQNDFDNFDDGDSVDFDDGDIEDMSHDIGTEKTFNEADIDDALQTVPDEPSEPEIASVKSEDHIGDVEEKTADSTALSVTPEAEVSSDDSDKSDESDDSEPAVVPGGIVDDIQESVPSEHITSGRIFFDDFDDSENVFEDDDAPIFAPHMVQSMDVTKSAAEAIESARAGARKETEDTTATEKQVDSVNHAGNADDADASEAEPAEEADAPEVAERSVPSEADPDESDDKNEDIADEPDDVPDVPVKKSIDARIKELRTARKKKKRQKKVRNFVKEIFGWIGLVFAAFFIAIVINLYVARPSVVSGRSMMPTLQNGDTIIISKVPYMLGEVSYGDIVVIDRQVNRERTFTVEVVESLKYNVLTQSLFDENELNEDIFWVKRIIGLPGDVIEFHEGKVYRNGELLSEGYIFTQDVVSYPDGQQFVVQEGCVFVMGDNRNESLDSRSLALHDEQIAMDHIVGKLISK